MTVAWSIRPEQRSRGGGSRRHRGAAGFAQCYQRHGVFQMRWRWRHETSWIYGATPSAEEAQRWLTDARASLALGNEPPAPPVYVSPAQQPRTSTKISLDVERCPRCHLLRPCDPCINELTREIRSARRGAP